MKFVQYLGPSDTFDASLILAKAGVVFHSPTNNVVNVDERGTIVEVTNDHFTELMTYPNHRFVEVSDTDAKALVAAQTKARFNREGLAQLRAQHETPGVVATSIADQVASIAPNIITEDAVGAVRSQADIRREVQAETRAAAQAVQPTAGTQAGAGPVTGTTNV